MGERGVKLPQATRYRRRDHLPEKERYDAIHSAYYLSTSQNRFLERGPLRGISGHALDPV